MLMNVWDGVEPPIHDILLVRIFYEYFTNTIQDPRTPDL